MRDKESRSEPEQRKPERIRLFVALDVPEAVRSALAELSRTFGAKLKQTGGSARWVRLEGVHVTLKFIGEVELAQAERIRNALREVYGIAPVELKFAGVGFFPNAKRPRVLWAGVEGNAPLGELAAAIGNRLLPLGIPHEAREFRPHITLARFGDRRTGPPRELERLRAATAELEQKEFGRIVAKEFHLYRSVLKPGGAEYTRLETFSFAGDQPAERGL